MSSKTEYIIDNSRVHMGQILERVIRRDRMGISELSRRLEVSRRTLYNWFDMETISLEIICNIGNTIGHDFSIEFPEEFAKKNKFNKEASRLETDSLQELSPNAIYYWMNRYIKLLEKYTEVLSHDVTKNTTLVTLLALTNMFF
jgi:hypothetical protein